MFDNRNTKKYCVIATSSVRIELYNFKDLFQNLKIVELIKNMFIFKK